MAQCGEHRSQVKTAEKSGEVHREVRCSNKEMRMYRSKTYVVYLVQKILDQKAFSSALFCSVVDINLSVLRTSTNRVVDLFPFTAKLKESTQHEGEHVQEPFYIPSRRGEILRSRRQLLPGFCCNSASKRSTTTNRLCLHN